MKKKNNWVMKNWYFILIPIFIILLSFAEIHYLNKPDYIITKEVCYQEKITDKLIFPEDFNLTTCPKNISGTCYKDIYVGEYFLAVENIDEYVSVISCKLTNFTENNYSIKIKGDIYKTICNQEEVEDNIIYWCYSNDDCGKIQIGDRDEIWGIEWLKENCECIDKPYGMSVCKWDVPDDCIIDRSITGLYTVNSSRPECLNCGQEDVFPEDCTKFKCGNYQVEVLR